MVLQSVVVPKKKCTKAEATAWIKKHGYKSTFNGHGPEETKLYWRFRQVKPPGQGHRYYIKNLPGGVKLVEYV